MKVKVLTLYTAVDEDWTDIINCTSYYNSRYCKKRGYQWVVENKVLSNREPSWSKIILLQRELCNCDYAVWADADGIILDKPLDQLFKGELSIAQDENGLSGSFMVWKNSEHNKGYLEKIWNTEQFIDHGWWEQAAIMHLYETDPIFHSNVTTFSLDDWFYHEGGITGYEKLALLRKLHPGDVLMI